MSTVEILLAVYNSATYLTDTLESICCQDFTDWRLLIRDGGSIDETNDIIHYYAGRYPDKIVIVESAAASGAVENFSALLSRASAEYVMFCDHDDVWRSDKISNTLAAMHQAQALYGDEMPLLVFTDLNVVAEDLRPICESYFRYQRLDPGRLSLNYLLVQNVPSGCTMMLNRSLASLCDPIPPQAVMHDHWVSLNAAAFGRIVYLDKRTLLYRQHGTNVYGTFRYGMRYFVKRYNEGLQAVRKRFLQNVDQAAIFYRRHQQTLRPEHRLMLECFSSWRRLSWLGRRRVLLRHRILKTGLRRNLGMLSIV